MIEVKLLCLTCRNVDSAYVDADKLRKLLDGEPGPGCCSDLDCKSQMYLDQRPWLVRLSYFKASGKYYSDGYYTTHRFHMYEIFFEVKELLLKRTLPGLIHGSHFHIVMDVPGHPHNHPELILDQEAE